MTHHSDDKTTAIVVILLVLFLSAVLGIAMAFRPEETYYFSEPAEVRAFMRSCEGTTNIVQNYETHLFEVQCHGELKE